MASSKWMASVQRSGEKSSGSFSPMGKLSSDLKGCSNRSTSSMISTPRAIKVSSTRASARTSRSMDGWCLRRSSRRQSSFSRSLSWTDLIEVAVQRTIPRCATAERSLSTSSHVASDERSKLRVKTRLRMIDEKAERSVARVCSSSAGGIIWMTSAFPSPSMSERIGEITVVLPPPISICFTMGSPARTLATNSKMRSTWAFRSSTLCTNSKSRSRGSKMRSSPPPYFPPFEYFAGSVFPPLFGGSASTKWREVRSRSASASARRETLDRSSAPNGCRVRANAAASVSERSSASASAMQRLVCPMRVAWQTVATTRSKSVAANCSVRKGLRRQRSRSPCDEMRRQKTKSSDALASAPASCRSMKAVRRAISSMLSAERATLLAELSISGSALDTYAASSLRRSLRSAISSVRCTALAPNSSADALAASATSGTKERRLGDDPFCCPA
mmetsp:Transcript_10639/g.26844  ORF Transcript_10639/g.26844 Transcript_10639/m.26844 type:complete len:447 (+) Transcript_10639:4151-5491(+)